MTNTGMHLGRDVLVEKHGEIHLTGIVVLSALIFAHCDFRAARVARRA